MPGFWRRTQAKNGASPEADRITLDPERYIALIGLPTSETEWPKPS